MVAEIITSLPASEIVNNLSFLVYSASLVGAVMIKAARGRKFKELKYDDTYGCGKLDGQGGEGSPKLVNDRKLGNMFFIPHGAMAQATSVVEGKEDSETSPTYYVNDTPDSEVVEAYAGVVVETGQSKETVTLSRDNRKIKLDNGDTIVFWTPDDKPALDPNRQRF